MLSQLAAAGAAVLAAAAVTLLAGAALHAVAVLRAFRRTVLAALADASGRVVPAHWRSAIAEALRRAGRPGDLSPDELVALVLLCAAAFLGAGAVGCFSLGLGVVAIPGAALSGAAVPLLWVRDRARARRTAIARALPYHLDLLTLSVEAGLDFAAALGKVVEKGREGPLSDELSITLKELRLGRIREDALRDLADRAGMPALTSFAHALAQADRMGTPLGKILRVLSGQMRAERTQRAEKLAGEAPVKLLLPLIGCIFPTLFLMLFGPIAYQMFLGGDF
ncbi:MAG TPA: type II secretion system F family protein [Myxococcales bacterium]|nr:type II secretion system F family protein [Myxococcales bacterium]